MTRGSISSTIRSAVAFTVLAGAAAATRGASPPQGFQETVVFTGISNPDELRTKIDTEYVRRSREMLSPGV